MSEIERERGREGGERRKGEKGDPLHSLPWSAAEINLDMKLFTAGAMTASIPNRTPTTHTHTKTHTLLKNLKRYELTKKHFPAGVDKPSEECHGTAEGYTNHSNG